MDYESEEQKFSYSGSEVYNYINLLCHPDTRENALMELSTQRDSIPDLGMLLWNSFGSIAALIQEIVNIYPSISLPSLTIQQSNRACSALSLLQCVATHPNTRFEFLKAHIPLFLYPILNTSSSEKPIEYLRLTSLGVIGSLVRTDHKEVITFLLSTEIVPLCLQIMEQGEELSKIVATFILLKILVDGTGLNFVCHTYERFATVAVVLGKMVIGLVKQPSTRLLKHVVRCYMQLSENPRASEALSRCLPEQLINGTFDHYLDKDYSTLNCIEILKSNIGKTQLFRIMNP